MTHETRPPTPDPTTDLPDRRHFMQRLSLGAMTMAVASVSAALPTAEAQAEPSDIRGPWSDAWLDRIKGKHKQFFDATSTNEGFALAFAAFFLNLNHEAYGLDDNDLTAVVGFRHFAMPMALPDELWQKYKIGESLKIMDPATKTPAIRNPFMHSDGVPMAGLEIPTLAKRGVIFTACNVALTIISGNLAGNAGVSADAAKAEWTAGLLPGVTLVPVGVLAVNRAQEKGCTYCYAG